MNALLEQALVQLRSACEDMEFATPSRKREAIAKAISACDVVRSQLKAM